MNFYLFFCNCTEMNFINSNYYLFVYHFFQVLVDQWKKLQHGNLVALRQVFTTKSFNDHSMVFVYDFYAGAETLFSRHFSGSNQMSGNGGQFMDPYR